MLGSETAETNLRTLLLPRYSQLLGVDVGERDCGNESADAAVTISAFFSLVLFFETKVLFCPIKCSHRLFVLHKQSAYR